MKSYTCKLREVADPLWEQEKNHPLVTGIGDGSLPLEIFSNYLKQDYVFLIEFARVISIAVTKSEEIDSMAWFSTLLNETLNSEMDLHVSFCKDFSITLDELKATKMSPTTYEYTSHLMTVALKGETLEIATAILPCMWGYSEIGKHLHKQGLPQKADLHAKWIEMYSSDEFAELTTWLRNYIDECVTTLPKSRLTKLESIFLTSSVYEGKFWESAYNLETWDDPTGKLIIS